MIPIQNYYLGYSTILFTAPCGKATSDWNIAWLWSSCTDNKKFVGCAIGWYRIWISNRHAHTVDRRPEAAPEIDSANSAHITVIKPQQSLSHSRDNACHLRHVPLRLSTSISMAPTGWVSVRNSIKICRETPNLVKIEQKYQTLYLKP